MVRTSIPAILALFMVTSLVTRAVQAEEAADKRLASALVKIVTKSKDKTKRADAAKALGDLYLEGKVKLDEKDQAALGEKVLQYIKEGQSPPTREEATKQVQRLWRLAVPALLEGVKQLDTFSFSTKMLILMRNEETVKAIVTQAKNTKDAGKKGLYRFALQRMKGEQEPQISDRPVISQEESARIYKEIIEPALGEL